MSDVVVTLVVIALALDVLTMSTILATHSLNKKRAQRFRDEEITPTEIPAGERSKK